MTTFGEALVKLLEAHVGQVFSRFHAARPRLSRDSTRSVVAAIAIAATLLAEAKRPLMLVGGGAADAASEIQLLCELLDCPVISTTSGKGILSEDHPLTVSRFKRP